MFEGRRSRIVGEDDARTLHLRQEDEDRRQRGRLLLARCFLARESFQDVGKVQAQADTPVNAEIKSFAVSLSDFFGGGS